MFSVLSVVSSDYKKSPTTALILLQAKPSIKSLRPLRLCDETFPCTRPPVAPIRPGFGASWRPYEVRRNAPGSWTGPASGH